MGEQTLIVKNRSGLQTDLLRGLLGRQVHEVTQQVEEDAVFGHQGDALQQVRVQHRLDTKRNSYM